jgi:hypothetical protein
VFLLRTCRVACVRQECSWEVFLRLKPSLTTQDAKHMKFWRFKACAMHLRVPVSSMMEVLSISRSSTFVFHLRGKRSASFACVIYTWEQYIHACTRYTYRHKCIHTSITYSCKHMIYTYM